MNYEIVKPENYQKVPFPGLNEWITALRSGKYEQGARNLKTIYSNGEEYCCLGILCELRTIPFKTTVMMPPDPGDGYIPHSIDIIDDFGSSGFLPRGVSVNLKFSNEDITRSGSLAGLNDKLVDNNIPNGFNIIADILEEIYIHTDLPK